MWTFRPKQLSVFFERSFDPVILHWLQRCHLVALHFKVANPNARSWKNFPEKFRGDLLTFLADFALILISAGWAKSGVLGENRDNLQRWTFDSRTPFFGGESSQIPGKVCSKDSQTSATQLILRAWYHQEDGCEAACLAAPFRYEKYSERRRSAGKNEIFHFENSGRRWGDSHDWRVSL